MDSLTEEKKNRFHLRKVVSISLFLLLIILFSTAVGLEVFEDEPEFVEVHGIFTGIHILSGFLFCCLSIIHIIKNGKVLLKYLKK